MASEGAGWLLRTWTQAKASLGLANVDNTTDANKPISTATATALATKLTIGSDAWLKSNINDVAYTAITRDSNGAATSATVVWPDTTPGTYTATTVSTAFPGAVDAFSVTYGSPVQKTVTQPAVTRDPSTGAVSAQPALTVS